ncbi:MAG: hypothetical protein AAF533_07560 [Acidobacteriota bacterium]
MAVVVTTALLALVPQALSGRTARAYPVLAPEAIVVVAGQPRSVADLLQHHRPVQRRRPATPSPPLSAVRTEAVEAEGRLDLVYYFSWENEIAPRRLLHLAYALFRAARYGTVEDIEAHQVSVDLASGEVVRLRFDSTTSDDYFELVPRHDRQVWVREPDGVFRGRTWKGELRQVPCWEGERVVVGVHSWNHCSRLLTVDELPAFSLVDEAPLVPLDDASYRRLKMTRRGAGDHGTLESPGSRWLSKSSWAVLGLVPAVALGWWWRRHRVSTPAGP